MDMTFTGFLLQLSFNWLVSALPFAITIYFTVRLSIKHGLSDAAKIARQPPQSISSHRAVGE